MLERREYRGGGERGGERQREGREVEGKEGGERRREAKGREEEGGGRGRVSNRERRESGRCAEWGREGERNGDEQ